MIPAFPLYLFDVDGTLVDSADDICGAIQTVLSSTPRNDVDQTFLKRYIGYHLLELFGDLFPEMASDEIDNLICKYRSVYPARDHRSTAFLGHRSASPFRFPTVEPGYRAARATSSG